MSRMGLLVIGVALLLVGCTAAPPETQPSPAVTAAPRESVVEARSAELVPVEPIPQPTSVEIPAAGIAMSVQPVGIQPDGLMELPVEVAVAGWYRFGPAPASETGTTVFASHVDSLEYGIGPFAQLKTLPAGTEVVVTDAAGELHRYAIVSIVSVQKQQLPVGDLFDRSGPRRLVLITCGGQFDTETLTYSDNIVAIAEPLP